MPMRTTQVRTRFFNKLHNAEIEDYLRVNDIIFIPIGTVAAHGSFPLDVEETFARALALKMAEKTDGLVFGGLPFLYAGAAATGRGTVQISVKAGTRYLKELSYSLLNQGFRRQIYVATGETGYITAGGVVIDFFDETKCPITLMNLENLIAVANENNPTLGLKHDRVSLDTMTYGAYKILGREREIVIDSAAKRRSGDCPVAGTNTEHISYLLGTRRPAGTAGYYYENADDHYGSYGAVSSAEEFELLAAEGVGLIDHMIDALDLERYMTHMRNLDIWTNTYIKSKYGGNLPKNKFGEWR